MTPTAQIVQSPSQIVAQAQELATAIQALSVPEQIDTLNRVREALHAVSPVRLGPVDLVRWVPMAQVEGNTYNPNAVATVELNLLFKSIEADGYTQPIVVIKDHDRQIYTTVDGFHRGAVMKAHPPLAAKYHGHLPIVVIEKDLNDRMASTVRHNRARGRHSVEGMANMVFQMLDNGMDDASICNELGMEAEELVRLKHITGFSKLFENVTYSRAWTTRAQVLLKQARAAKAPTP